MFQNIIQAEIENKKKYHKIKKVKKKENERKKNTHSASTQTYFNLMCDKSTSTEDLVKQEKERKILEKFKKETKKKQKQAELFKQVLGTPRNIEEVEDE